MFTETLIAILLGIAAGIVTGLIPGIHINLVSMLLLSVSAYLLNITTPITLAAFIIAMGITHSFLDSIPSVFLGAPDPGTALNVLPGHRLLLEGKGFEAVKLTVIGSLLCLILTIILIPVLIPLLPAIYAIIKPYIGWILLAVVLFMILKDKDPETKLWNIILFIIAGTLGIIVLNFPTLNNPLFPMLSGLFGVSTLLLSLNDQVILPTQTFTETIIIPKLETVKALFAGVFSGSLTGMFPGLGSAQAAIIGTQLARNIGKHAFMVLVGGINTVNFIFSLATLYSIDKARNGAVIVVKEIIGKTTLTDIAILLSTGLIVGGIATFLTLKITKFFAIMIAKVNYKATCITIILFITLLTLHFSGIIGLLVLITSTVVGMIAPLKGIGRNLAMGCLMLPVIFYFL